MVVLFAVAFALVQSCVIAFLEGGMIRQVQEGFPSVSKKVACPHESLLSIVNNVTQPYTQFSGSQSDFNEMIPGNWFVGLRAKKAKRNSTSIDAEAESTY